MALKFEPKIEANTCVHCCVYNQRLHNPAGGGEKPAQQPAGLLTVSYQSSLGISVNQQLCFYTHPPHTQLNMGHIPKSQTSKPGTFCALGQEATPVVTPGAPTLL